MQCIALSFWAQRKEIENISKKRTKDSDGCPQRMNFHVSYSLFGVALTFYVRDYIKLHCYQEEAGSCSAVSATSVMLY